MQRPPEWLVDEPFTETDLGTLRSGKEAQIDVVERIDGSGRACLLARKRYLPRRVEDKGALEALGVQRASTFSNDAAYRADRTFAASRDRRAVARKSRYGRELLRQSWTGHEHDVLGRLWDAGAAVPYPVSFTDDVLLLEYLGDHDGAAPQLAGARLAGADLASAWDQLVVALRTMTEVGIVHADLSAYNLLWWRDALWVIDLPQAVDLAANPAGLDMLHRDVLNVCAWFRRRGLDHDPEELFADLVTVAYR